MKKVISLLLLISAMFYIGCKTNNAKDLIVNKWRISDIQTANQVMSDSEKNTRKGLLEFTKEGNFSFKGNGWDQSGQYSISDDGKILTVTTDGKSQSSQIVELNKSKLVLYDKLNDSKLTAVP